MRRTIAIAALLAAPCLAAAPAAAQERYIGEVLVTAANFCPRFTLPADGRILQIESNQALFSLLGTSYGGDGRTTFALPDLTGRTSVGAGPLGGGAFLRPGDAIDGVPAPIPENEVAELATTRRPENPGVYDLSEPLEHPDDADRALDAVPAADTDSAPRLNAGAGVALSHCIVVQGLYPARN